MGNQARVDEGSVVFSSTRNFDNRLGKNAQVFLGSAELAAVCALLGKIPEVKNIRILLKIKLIHIQMNFIAIFNLMKYTISA